MYRRVADHPAVQGTAGVLRAKAGELVHRPGMKRHDEIPEPRDLISH